MRKAKLVGIAALALFAFAAFGASAAFAESPELLILSGSVEELEGTLKAPAAKARNRARAVNRCENAHRNRRRSKTEKLLTNRHGLTQHDVMP